MRSARMTAAVAVLLCAANAATARDLLAAEPVASWTSIASPIPRAALLAALDLDPELSRTLTLVQVVRRLHEDDTRRGTLRTRLIAALAAAGAVPKPDRGTREATRGATAIGAAAGASASGDDDLLPLPLNEKF